jgi:hypothetical protein
MPSRLSRPIYASMFTPVERNFVDYVHSSPRTLLTGERGAFAPRLPVAAGCGMKKRR